MGLSSGTVSALIVGIISAIAAPLAGIVARDYGQGDENKIAIGSAGVCIASTILIYLLALRGKTAKRGSTGYLIFFAFFTFACMCDLWLGLAIDKTPSLSVMTDLTFSVDGNIVITISAFLIVSLRDLPGVPPTFTTGSILLVATS